MTKEAYIAESKRRADNWKNVIYHEPHKPPRTGRRIWPTDYTDFHGLRRRIDTRRKQRK